MALQIQANNGTVFEAGGATFKALHVHPKPLEYGSLGHYRAAVKVQLIGVQAANARIFELRNTHATNLIIPTRFDVTVMPNGSVAFPYLLELALFRCTSFTAVDTLQTVTPTISPLRTGMAAAPGSAQVRHLGGASGGMTGGTLIKDATALSSLMAWAATVSSTSLPVTKSMLSLQTGEYPLVLAQNEGFELENVVLGSATNNAVMVMIELAWAEVPVSAY